MNRRHFLATVPASLLLAGCGSDDGPVGTSGGADNTTTPAPAQTDSPTSEPTPTDSPTPTETQTPDPAQFEVVEFAVPDSVRVGEDHTYGLTVRNTGGQTGTFEGVLEVSTSQTVEWQESATLTVGPIEPGETVTEESDPFSYSQAMTVQFRLADVDIQTSYDVVLPQPEISVGNSAFVEVDLGYTTTRMAEIEVTNTGEGAAGQVPLTVDWYDDDAYLASTDVSLMTLGTGETWLARADPTYAVDDPAAITDFEVNVGDVAGAAGRNPDGVAVANDELLASDQQVLVRGDIENNRDTALDYIEVAVQARNESGAIVGTEWTNFTEIAAGESVSFELEPDTSGRNGAVSSHEVVLLT